MPTTFPVIACDAAFLAQLLALLKANDALLREYQIGYEYDGERLVLDCPRRLELAFQVSDHLSSGGKG